MPMAMKKHSKPDQELTLLSDEQIEDQMREFHSSIDKLVFCSVMLAIGAKLPEEFTGSEFDSSTALSEIIPHIVELEKVIKEPDYPMNYMAYDLKAYGVVVTHSLLNENFKNFVVNEMLRAYETGKKVTGKNIRFYTINWDRCYSLKYIVPEAGRPSLPLYSEILKAVAKGHLNLYDQPYLAITSMVNTAESEICDMGEKYRDILRIEEEEVKKKAKTTQRVVNLKNQASTLEAKVEAASTEPIEVIDAKKEEVVTPAEPAEVIVPEVNDSTAQELQGEFKEALFEEVEKMAASKKTSNANVNASREKIAGAAVEGIIEEIQAKGKDNISDEEIQNAAMAAAMKEAVKQLGEGNLDLEDLARLSGATEAKVNEVTGKSWTKDEGFTTGEKVFIGVAGAAVVGGIGYGIYRYLQGRDTTGSDFYAMGGL